MKIKDILNEQRIYALLHDVPILRESEVELFEDLIGLYKPKRVLEVGTAIGYSSLLLAKYMDKEGQLISIELDDIRHSMAKHFISQSDYADRMTLLQGDATELVNTIEGPFDLVFLDGPKGQYLKQLEIIEPKLSDGAVVLADNVLFRDYVRGGKEPPRRFKTIVKRLQHYLDYVEQKDKYNTTIYPMGDGMSVSVWKGHNHE